jgi:hypothetical protein
MEKMALKTSALVCYLKALDEHAKSLGFEENMLLGNFPELLLLSIARNFEEFSTPLHNAYLVEWGNRAGINIERTKSAIRREKPVDEVYIQNYFKSAFYFIKIFPKIDIKSIYHASKACAGFKT